MSDATSAWFICRCEEIEHAAIEKAIREGSATLNDLKRRTRAGMGVCQGVYCLPEMAALLASAGQESIDDLAPMTSRPPARLITLGDLAALGGDSENI